MDCLANAEHTDELVADSSSTSSAPSAAIHVRVGHTRQESKPMWVSKRLLPLEITPFLRSIARYQETQRGLDTTSATATPPLQQTRSGGHAQQ